MAEWELSKENIQPLRQGRKVSAMLDLASMISFPTRSNSNQKFQNEVYLRNKKIF